MSEPSEQWTVEQHIAWRHTFQQLRDERDMLTGVCTRFVLDGEWDLATNVAKEYEAAQRAVRAHAALLNTPAEYPST